MSETDSPSEPWAATPSGSGAAVPETILLTVLGTNPSLASYSLGDLTTQAQLAPVALLELLPEAARPHRVLALCTPQAKDESWPVLQRALGDRYCMDLVQVSGGDTPEQVDEFLQCVTEAIPSEVEITVDVTHGFRHFSFLTYIAVLYVAALREVRVRAAYYGLLRRGEASPFLDLKPLLELPEWLYALRVLRDTGSALPMVKLLREAPSNQQNQQIEPELTELSEACLSGLPIELGAKASRIRERFRKPLRRLLTGHYRLPLGNELCDRIHTTLEPFALRDQKFEGDGWKGQIRLTERELKRQACVIDDLLDRRNMPTALGLLSEWTVSWAILLQGEEGRWLDYDTARRSAATLLGAIENIGRDGSKLKHKLTDDQRALGTYWGQLRQLRNGYAHHGMRLEPLVDSKKTRKNRDHVEKYWRETLRHCPRVSLAFGNPRGQVLVSPIGMRPGVLFSALRVCDGEPALCLVICSRETEPKIDEARSLAGYDGPVKALCLKDPFGGRAEIDRLTKDARADLVDATKVVVNVTGGTTLMGLVAEALADAARKLACPVRRFGLIDRRPPAEQDADPYRLGEPYWLDGADSGGALGD